jgi:transcriptional regulator with XRE-family HTH domain
MSTAGQRLRALREQLGFTVREVEAASTQLATTSQQIEFAISRGSVSQIETKGQVPSIFRLHSLAVIYRRDLRELLSWFGINTEETAPALKLAAPRKSHRSESGLNTGAVRIPIRLDAGFDRRRTVDLERMIEQWGTVPLDHIADMVNGDYRYGYVGSEDFTMYPILPPGSFLQIDGSKKSVISGMWRSEYERPIYFVQTQGGYVCCWCSLLQEELTLQPHPLSPVPVRTLRHKHEAEVVGQVVGVAMRLVDWMPAGKANDLKWIGPRENGQS